jgi:hypothetical protein
VGRTPEQQAPEAAQSAATSDAQTRGGTWAGDAPVAAQLRGMANAMGNRAFARLAQDRRAPGPRVLARRRVRSREPFKRVLDLHARYALVLEELVADLERVANPTEPLRRHLDILRTERDSARSRRDGANSVVAAYLAGEPYDRPEFAVDALNYVQDDRPASRSIARIAELLDRQITIAEIIRPRALAFVRHTDPLGADAPDFVRATFATVAGYYLELVERPSAGAYERLGFLESYYRDPAVVEGYAIAGHVREQIAPLYKTLRQAQSQGEGFAMDETLRENPFRSESIREMERGGVSRRRLAGVMRTYNQLIALRAAAGQIGDAPRSLAEVGAVPRPDDSRTLAAWLFQVQVRTALLMLWQPIDSLRSLVYSHNAIGTTLNPFVRDADTDRTRWLGELTALEVELWAELERGDHPDVARRIGAWERRVQRLIDEIPPEARKWHIIRAVAEQIPFIFVAGATVMRVGLWVRGLTASRWLVALAEGATMTAFSAIGSRPGSPGRPTTAIGWAGHFAINVVFAGFARYLFEGGQALAQLVRARSALANFGLRVAAPSATLAVVQTGAQSLEAHARGRGGETSFSELLTVNLVMHAMGIAVGMATMQDAARAPTGALPTARELSVRLSVSEDVARQMLEIAARMQHFAGRASAIRDAARAGRLSRDAFREHQREALELADWLEARLIAIARGGGLGATTPAEVQAAMGVLRARIQATSYSERPSITGLLPEHVGGLRAVGEGPTWVYDASAPPRQLPALRSALERSGHTIRALPSGGWEARDAAGRLAAQVLPVSSAAARALPAPAEQAADAQIGATGLVRAGDTPTNLIAAQVTQLAAHGLSPAEVGTLLGVMAPVEALAAADWLGAARLREVARAGAPASRELLTAHDRIRPLLGDAAAMAGLARLVRTERRHPSDNPLKSSNVLAVINGVPATRLGALLRVIGQPGARDPHGMGKRGLLDLAARPSELDFLDRFGVEQFRVIDARRGHWDAVRARLYDQSGARTLGDAEARRLVDELVRATPRQRDDLLGIVRPPPRRIYAHGRADETAPDWAAYLSGAEAFVRARSTLVNPRTELPYGTDIAGPARAYAHLQQVHDRIVPRWGDYQRRLTYEQKRQILDQLSTAAEVGGLQPGWRNQLIGSVTEALFSPQGTRQISIPNPLHPAAGGGQGYSRPDGFFAPAGRAGANPAHRDWLELKSHDLTPATLPSRGEGRAVLLARDHAGEATQDWHALLAHKETRGDRIVIHYVRPPRDQAVRAAMLRELFGADSAIAAVRFGDDPWIERPASAPTPAVPTALAAPPTRSLPGIGMP